MKNLVLGSLALLMIAAGSFGLKSLAVKNEKPMTPASQAKPSPTPETNQTNQENQNNKDIQFSVKPDWK